ncbi:hypothetical protein L3X38_030333 [Prunus dulcis]|uniref:Uncharacterized protein n=1 Tax=Prunus dulcis TaxID=3755 RepID=A0AAD4YSY8_PRUDU|nr:hypothetical protein L3X38_030333 [Prunus dulcis]
MRSEEHHSELELAFNEGFDKFRAFAATTHTSYDWNYVSPDAVREILDDGGDMNEHNHVKAARKKPTDPITKVYKIVPLLTSWKKWLLLEMITGNGNNRVTAGNAALA